MKANELTVGQRATLTRQVTAEAIAEFAAVSGDTNPVHLDEGYASQTVFGGRVAHGMMVASYFSALLGNHLPGVGTIYLSQSVRFLKPVRINDTITAEVEVLAVDCSKNRATLRTRCFNQDGVDVLLGEAVVLCPA